MNQLFKICRITTKDAERIASSNDEVHDHDFEELIVGMEGENEVRISCEIQLVKQS